MREGYSVTVSKLGEPILTIEREMLTGAELSHDDEAAVRDAARHLLSFVGEPQTGGAWIDGEKLDACPCCMKSLDQAEYDFQFCASCPL